MPKPFQMMLREEKKGGEETLPGADTHCG